MVLKGLIFKVLKMVLKTLLEPFREPFKVPPVGQPKNPFFSKSAEFQDFFLFLFFLFFRPIALK